MVYQISPHRKPPGTPPVPLRLTRPAAPLHVMDLGHDHALFVPVSATKIRDKSPHPPGEGRIPRGEGGAGRTDGASFRSVMARPGPGRPVRLPFRPQPV